MQFVGIFRPNTPLITTQQIAISVLCTCADMPHFCIVNERERRRNEKKRQNIDHGTETFHEIIYGKSDAAQTSAAFFFACTDGENGNWKMENGFPEWKAKWKLQTDPCQIKITNNRSTNNQSTIN